MADKSNDPVAVWRKMFDDMERAFGAFALRAMTPPQFARPAGTPDEVAAGAKSGAEGGSAAAPSADVAGRLDSIEAQLREIKDLLQEMKPKPGKPRPPRAKSLGEGQK